MSSQKNSPKEKPVASIDILNDSDDEDEQIKINLKSKSIEITYFQLSQYSKLVREDYTINDIRENFSTKLQQFIDENGVNEDNVILFFKLIQKENVQISGLSFMDLVQISTFFKSNQIKKFLQKFLKQNLDNTTFIIDLMLINKSNEKKNIITIDDFTIDLEDILKGKLKDCLRNENFSKLSIPVISNIIELSELDNPTTDQLYDFIIKNIDERYTLFPLIEVEKLSDNKFDDLYDHFIKEKQNKHYFKCFNSTLKYLKKLKDENKKQELQINSLSSENKKLKNRFYPHLSYTYCQVLYRFFKKCYSWYDFYTACLFGNFDIIKRCIELTTPDTFHGLISFFF